MLKHTFILYILSVLLYFIYSSKEINNLLKWAKKNQIYILPNLKIQKPDKHHYTYYFKTDSDLKNETVLLKVPLNITLCQPNLLDYFKSKKIKKYINLWDKVNSLGYKKQKQARFEMLYLSAVMGDLSSRKKGELYNLYKEYFEYYEDINLSNFPLYYSDEEKAFLFASNLGNELQKIEASFQSDYDFIKKVKKFEFINQEEFNKFRVLSIANSIDYMNSSYLIPLIDLFTKRSFFKTYNAVYRIENGYFEILSNKDIKSNDEIFLKNQRIFSDSDTLLYFGFTDIINDYMPKFYIRVLHHALIKRYNLSNDIYGSLDDNNTFELGKIDQDYVLDRYKNLTEIIPKFKNGGNKAPFYLMKENLDYYVRMYKRDYQDKNITRFIVGSDKIKDIKRVIAKEMEYLDISLEFVEKLINYIVDDRQIGNITGDL